jgi:O-methyltransferase
MTATSVSERYLELLKTTLLNALWPEPPRPVPLDAPHRGLLRRHLTRAAIKALASRGMTVVRPGASKDQVLEGRVWPEHALTMIGRPRLDHLHRCLDVVVSDGVTGDLIETGVWRGGACIFMRGFLAAHGITARRVFVADSFAGLPPPDTERFPRDEGGTLWTFEELAVSRAQVEDNFRKLDLLDDQVVFLQGWFKDTLPRVPSDRLALLRLDGDMYESTTQALTHLYPKLSSGGFCIIDDFGAIEACAAAVHDYRREHGIEAPLEEVDWTARAWRKP